MTTESLPRNFNLSELSRRVAAVAMTGVALIGCSSGETSNDSQVQPPDVSVSENPVPSVLVVPSATSESLAPRECSFRFVQPGLNLSEQNTDDLKEDLAQMTELYQASSEVGLRDIAGVGRIIKDSYQDPLYVQAISQARETIADGQTLSATELLDLPVKVPASCDANHIEKSAAQDQTRQTVSLSQSLTRQLGSRLGDRASELTKRAYETLQREVDNLRDRAEAADRQPS